MRTARTLLGTAASRLRAGVVLPAVAAVCHVAFALPSLGKVGLTWDEPIYLYASKAYWLYYVKLLGTGRGPTDPAMMALWQVNNEHPPVAKSLSSLTWGIALALGGGHLDTWASVAAHRASTLLLAAVAVFLIGRLTATVSGPLAGGVAAFALAFTPRFFAHSRYLALDVPMAATWVVAVWAFRRAFDDDRYAAAVGVGYGLALATKLNAFFVPVAVGVWLAVSYRDVLRDRLASREFLPVGRRERYAAASLIVLSPLTLFAAWPYLWVNPVQHFATYLGFHLGHYDILLYYLGQTYPGPGPWHYPFVMVAVTVPATVLALALVGAGRAVSDAYTLDNRDTPVLLVNALVPLVVIALPTHAYDGVRLFMPAFPFVAGLAGVGAADVAQLVRTRYLDAPGDRSVADLPVSARTVRRYGPAALLILLVVGPGATAYVADGAHENTYFNGVVGGRGGAYDAGFEMEFWQQAYAETVPFLNDRAAREGEIQVYVAVGGGPFDLYRHGDFAYFDPGDLDLPGWVDRRQEGPLSDRVEFVGDPADADYYAFITRQSHFGSREWRLIETGRPAFQYSLDGAPLVQVYRTNETNGFEAAASPGDAALPRAHSASR